MSDSPTYDWLTLDDDEEILWSGKPATEEMYGAYLVGVPLILLAGLGLLIIAGTYLTRANTDYVVTTESLYVKSGVFSTNIETVDLDRIQNTEYNRSFWGKQFGYGSISISTAGSSGAEISFDGIPDAPAVRDHVTELQRRTSGRGDDGTGGDRADGTPASADQIAELIEEVRATREAFERIERHLVDGEARSVSSTEGDFDGQSDADDGAAGEDAPE